MWCIQLRLNRKSTMKKNNIILFLSIIGILISFPPQWYPLSLKISLTSLFGANDYVSLPESKPQEFTITNEAVCPEDLSGWGNKQTIEGIEINESKTCVSDNPFLVAASVLGTNNISNETLSKSGLSSDAIEKGRDLDGDGDPDEIHIKLEIAELNGSSPISDKPVTTYDIAPGIQPGLWVFAPKLAGMAVENFETQVARTSLKIPSPALRVEQGDTVKITIQNTHYMPHTLHLHGADHGFLDENGEGNDGVPIASEMPILPGESRTYNLKPRKAGTMFYHCHVQPHVHVQMGLQGLFVIEENKPNNYLQTMNVGAGKVRVPSQTSKQSYDSEYDIHYMDIDKELSSRIQESNDPRIVTKSMHRDYDITDANVDYFTLNGRSFPYTFRESLIVAESGKKAKLRLVNGGSKGISFHTHGHKFKVIERDGVPLNETQSPPQDVLWVPTSQRYDIELNFTNDGTNSYGPGIWLFHDHQNKGVTTDGIGPGGNISAIVYDEFLDDDGWPISNGMNLNQYFSSDYYDKEIPIWGDIAPEVSSNPKDDIKLIFRLILLALFFGIFFSCTLKLITKGRKE